MTNIKVCGTIKNIFYNSIKKELLLGVISLQDETGYFPVKFDVFATGSLAINKSKVLKVGDVITSLGLARPPYSSPDQSPYGVFMVLANKINLGNTFG